MKITQVCYRLIVVFFSIFTVNTASAAINIALWPINQHINTDNDRSVLWLRNTGNDNADLSVRVFAWHQKNGDNILNEQNDINVVPPVVGILPADSEYIRLFTLPARRQAEEQAYRIVIDEVPRLNSPERNKVALRMRYVLPLFVAGSQTPKGYQQDGDALPSLYPSLRWHFATQHGKRVIALQNTGPVHARLSDIALANKQGKTLRFLKRGLYGYILPGSTMYISLPADLTINSQQQLTARFFDGDVKPTTIKSN
ncbi:hypothetical protein BL250_15155 [Erwinia sp. OLTSP20]|uniref:fimbrial biogenesis chaperone n=1 Tax=unclassified Erwinia TaxID=2622719 RepID=UPI000C1A3355|nr:MULTISPECIES: fimbria/pilus periplasmic chaperone [unclassified Erwinia]PIJ48479.1 hypothetical protein BV501_16940 [Erwinia sp. OAMSP11]PIJ75975.1 hypothetical protein BK416_00345 [Erwinia sp. OLSSP12]PIJ78875.1 hypothetical protein BLD47_16290 [Erwinia sp. OLCASP19]PIJ87435.1 hypothetical protein BLD46_00365 [Erwinia sp. OLMTSP26]PIJ88985.1 hypothetical protein BLD49_00365 [Erwinia sp. OLMDSP33]